MPIVTLGSGTTLRLNGWNYETEGSLGRLSFSRAQLVIDGGTIEYVGNSNVTDGQAGRNFTVGTGGATLKAMTLGQTWTISDRIEPENNTIENSNGLTLGGVGDGVLAKPIGGSGNLNKVDSGNWTLTGISTNSGSFTVSAGKLAITGVGKLYHNLFWQNRVVTIQNGGILEVDRWDGDGSLGQISFSAGNIVMNNGTIRYTGNSNATTGGGAGFTIGAGGATLESAAPVGQTWNINFDNRLELDFYIVSAASGILNLTGSGDGLISKIIPGAGGVTKDGGGTWTLSAINTYTGDTTVNSGTLQLDTDSLADSSTVSISTGATLNLNHGSTDVIKELIIGGVPQAPGIYKSSAGLGDGITLAELVGTGKLEVIPGPFNTFASWMASFDFAAFPGADQSANGDADNDGISNLIEQVFGTAPNAANTGMTQISAATNSVTFKHPLNPVPASNVSYSYEWSSDLVEWKASGESNSGNTSASITAAATVGNEVTVTTTTTAGPSAKLFIRVNAVETP